MYRGAERCRGSKIQRDAEVQRCRCGKGSEVKKFRGSEEQSQGGVVVQRCRGEKGSECRGEEVQR